jgi:1,4-alpha-glucan branching enzyme
MTPLELEAIIGGSEGDPFRVLGPHSTTDGWEVRAFLPQAMDAAVSINGILHPMRKTRAEGLFQARLKEDPVSYNLQLTLWNSTKI